METGTHAYCYSPLRPFAARTFAVALIALTVFLCLCTQLPIRAQAVDTLRENPNIHLLKHIWRVNGESENDIVGLGMGSVGDINGDGVSDIAYHTGVSRRWDVHLGAAIAPDVDTAWSISNIVRPHVKYPIVAEFIPGQMTVGFPTSRHIPVGAGVLLAPNLPFYDTAAGTLRDSASHVWDPQFRNGTKVGYFINQFIAGDLDRLPGEEFVVVSHARRNYAVDEWGNPVDRGTYKPEIWIYQGGKGFQLDTPSVIIPIVDSLPEIDAKLFHALISDFDGDEYPDLISIGHYEKGTLMHIWFGDSTSPWDWTSTPDRTMDVTSVGIRSEVTHGDYDGDGLLDFAGSILRDDRFITNVFLSGGAKSIRDRSLTEADVDRAIFTDVFQVVPGPAPYLNDSSRRYAMLALKGPSRFEHGSDMLYFLSGGRYGPNATADAFWAPSRDGVTSGPVANIVRPISDCNGDNFDDLMVGDWKWYYSLFDYGIALVLAGTDRIPNDDPTVGVRLSGMGSSLERLSIHPNPARALVTVNIPPGFQDQEGTLTVLSTLGESVHRTNVIRGTERLSLDVSDLPNGGYLLRLSDERTNETLEGLMIKEDSGE